MSDKKWFFAQGGQKFGPVTFQELEQYSASGRLLRDSFVWKEGMPTWKPAGEVPDLDSLFAGAPAEADPEEFQSQPTMVSFEVPDEIRREAIEEFKAKKTMVAMSSPDDEGSSALGGPGRGGESATATAVAPGPASPAKGAPAPSPSPATAGKAAPAPHAAAAREAAPVAMGASGRSPAAAPVSQEAQPSADSFASTPVGAHLGDTSPFPAVRAAGKTETPSPETSAEDRAHPPSGLDTGKKALMAAMPDKGGAVAALNPATDEGLPLLGTAIGAIAYIYLLVALYEALMSIPEWAPIGWVLGKLPAILQRMVAAGLTAVEGIVKLVAALALGKTLILLARWWKHARTGGGT